MALTLEDQERLRRAKALTPALPGAVNDAPDVASPAISEEGIRSAGETAGAPYRARAVEMTQKADATAARVKSEEPPAPKTIGEKFAATLMGGLQGYSAPGGYFGQVEKASQGERQRQQDLLAQAKQYREEGQKEEGLGLTEEQRQIGNIRAGIAQQTEQDKATRDVENMRLQRAMLQRNLEKDEEASKLGQGTLDERTRHNKAMEDAAKAKPGREYGVTEYQNDMTTSRNAPDTPEGKAAKQRADDYMNTKTQPGVAIAAKRGEENRETGDLATQRKEVTDKYNDFQNYDTNYKTMKEAYDRVVSGKSVNPGSDDMVLLYRHIGMTIGAVKGGRVNEAAVEAHLNALPADDRLKRAWLSIKNGEQLSQPQRDEFLHLGASTRDFHQAQYQQASKDYSWTPPGTNQPTAENGRIRVKNKATGQTGTISAGAFDPAKYERIQ